MPTEYKEGGFCMDLSSSSALPLASITLACWRKSFKLLCFHRATNSGADLFNISMTSSCLLFSSPANPIVYILEGLILLNCFFLHPERLRSHGSSLLFLTSEIIIYTLEFHEHAHDSLPLGCLIRWLVKLIFFLYMVIYNFWAVMARLDNDVDMFPEMASSNNRLP